MGKLRARLAKNDVDREALGHMASAENSLRQALGVYSQASKTASGQQKRRLKDIHRHLKNALNALSSARPMAPNYDLDDPDLQDRVVDRATKGREA